MNSVQRSEPTFREADGNVLHYAPLWDPSTELEAIRQIYNTESRETFDEGGQLDFQRLSRWFGEASTVLDLGCGIGRVARYVAPRCAKFWAVDVSPQMLKMTANRLGSSPNVNYTLCEDVSFRAVPSHSVDLAYSLLVLQHLEREDAFLLLEELRRVIRPDGTVVLTYPNLMSDNYMECFLKYAHERASNRPDRARIYTPQEVECLVTTAGLRAELDEGLEITVVAHPM